MVFHFQSIFELIPHLMILSLVFFYVVWLSNWCKVFYALDLTRSSKNAIQKNWHTLETRWNFSCFAETKPKKKCLVWNIVECVNWTVLFEKKSVWIHIWFWSTTIEFANFNKQTSKQTQKHERMSERATSNTICYYYIRLLSSLSHTKNRRQKKSRGLTSIVLAVVIVRWLQKKAENMKEIAEGNAKICLRIIIVAFFFFQFFFYCRGGTK